MFGINDFTLFAFTVLMINLTPGASVIFVITKSLSQGIKPAVFGAIGLGCGILVYAFLTAFGISAIIASKPLLFSSLKWAGGFYLVFLGIKSIVSRRIDLQRKNDGPAGSTTSWRQGIVINLLNPLIILFFLSVLPQFVREGNSNETSQLLFLGSWTAISATVVNSVFAIVFGMFGTWLMKFPDIWHYLKIITGVMLIIIGFISLI